MGWTMFKPDEEVKRNKLLRSKPKVYSKVIKYDEKLARGESIAILQLHYNYACNFKCKHCSISSLRKKEGEKFTPEKVYDLANQADEYGLGIFHISGGEPLVFPDLDKVIQAIGVDRFYICIETNGYLMTDETAQHLKDIGVDKIQLSLDGLNGDEYDDFRQRVGAFKGAMKAITAIKKAGLELIIATVVTHERFNSNEFLNFVQVINAMGIPVSVVWAKLVGEWEGKYDLLATPADMTRMRELEKEYRIFDHLTPSYGLNVGCMAAKRKVAITQYGDVLPCIWMYYTLGNVFKTPLKDILAKGMKYFSKYEPRCLMSSDIEFNKKYNSKTYGKELPLTIEEVMDGKGRTNKRSRTV
jgi:MoaA/NifB/PqqE/SkfB family radical SAM enzyme